MELIKLKKKTKKLYYALVVTVFLIVGGAGLAPVLANSDIHWGGESNTQSISESIDKLSQNIRDKKRSITDLNGNLDQAKNDLSKAQSILGMQQGNVQDLTNQVEALKTALANK